MRKYVTLDQHGCVHGDASIHHGIVPECLWPEYSSSETDDRIDRSLSAQSLARH